MNDEADVAQLIAERRRASLYHARQRLLGLEHHHVASVPGPSDGRVIYCPACASEAILAEFDRIGVELAASRRLLGSSVSMEHWRRRALRAEAILAQIAEWVGGKAPPDLGL